MEQQTPDVSPDQQDEADQALSPDEQRVRRLDALGVSLAKKRAEAIEARQSSGIEQQWAEDEEFYQGIDDANRHEHGTNAWRTKPPGQDFPQTKGAVRSTVFPNVIRPYTDAGAARISDMLLPTDDKAFSLVNTPISDLVAMTKGEVPDSINRELQAVPGATKESVQQVQAALVEHAKRIQDEAKAAAERSEKRIHDWQVEGQWNAEVRKVIEDAFRCGTGVLKGPIPVKRKKMALVDGPEEQKPNVLQKILASVKAAMGLDDQMQGKTLVMKEEIAPTSKRIDFWNFYPDGSCGENIHNGSYTWERDDLSERQVRELLENAHYIPEQIQKVLKEGPMKAVVPPKNEPDKRLEGRGQDKRFEIWYYYGDLNKEDLIAAGCKCDEEEVRPVIPAMVEMINGRVIKAAFNPLDTGDFPYDLMPLQRMSGLPWGKGIPRQGRTAQRIITAAVRNMMDNGGISGGFQLVLKQGIIVPADGTWEVTARKMWYVGEDADIDDVRKAMTFFEIPSRQAELQNIMEIGLKFMEDSTGLPMLLQGQLGKAPDTVGGMQMLNNNASAVLRRLARTFDDCITEPHIRRYYNWLLQYGEDEEKGDFVIDARGSSALVERDLQAQEIPQMAGIVVNPIFGLDPKKWAKELLKSRKLDPKNFEFDDEEWQKIVQNMAQGPQDPRVAVTKMTLEAKAQENAKDREVEVALALMDERLSVADITTGERETLQKLKASLAETVLKLNTQKQLSAASHAVGIHKETMKPPSEPKGRAPAGQSFQA